MIEVKIYSHLPDCGRWIREQVFKQEQGFEHEFDDKENISTHIVILRDGQPAATCRFFRENGKFVAARFAVLSKYRGMGLGKKLLDAVESQIMKKGGESVWLGARQSAKGFYENYGYEDMGIEYVDEYCPHVWMSKKLA